MRSSWIRQSRLKDDLALSRNPGLRVPRLSCRARIANCLVLVRYASLGADIRAVCDNRAEWEKGKSLERLEESR